MSIGRKIAQGREAEVYEWDGQADTPQVLKLFFGERSERHARTELEIARAVHAAGAPVPGVFDDLVVHDGRFGIVFERVQGTDMLADLNARPWRAGSAGRELGRLHARMHSARPQGLRSVKDLLARKIGDARGLSETEKAQVLDMLAALPDGDRIYHGDFHPGNVVLRDDAARTPVIIDWVNAAVGDPMADVARTRLLMSVGWRAAPGRRSRMLGRFFSAWVNRTYTRAYFKETGASPADVERWRTVIAAARLGEHIPEETRHVLKLVRSRLSQA